MNWMRTTNGMLLTVLVSLALAMVAFMFHNPILQFPSDSQFGILSLIPAEYWLALILSFVLMAVNITNKKRYCFFIAMSIFIMLFINMESFFLHNPVGTTDAYGHYFNGINLANSSNLFFSNDPLATYPQLYFGSFIFTKILVVLLGVDLAATVPLLSIFRILMPFWFFTCMYLLFKKLMPLTKARIIMILMIMSIPYFQFHYSPHAFGLIILPLLIYTIIVPARNIRNNFLLQLLLFSFLMFTHGPTTIYIALAYAFTAFMHYGLKSTKTARTSLNTYMPVAIYFLIGMSILNPLFYNLIFSMFSNLGLQAVINCKVNIHGIGIFNSGIQQAGILGVERLGGNFAMAELMRLYVLGIFAFIASFGTFQMFKKKEFTGLNLFILGGFLSTGILTIGNILYPSLNMGDRSFLYLGFGSILMLIYLLPDDIKNRLKGLGRIDKTKFMSALIILIMLSPMIGSLAYHYNQAGYFQSPQDEERYSFTVGHVDSAYVYRYWDNQVYINYIWERHAPGKLIFLRLIDFNPDSPTLDSGGTFIVISDSTCFMFKLEERTEHFNEILHYCDGDMNRVYSSPGNSVWYV